MMFSTPQLNAISLSILRMIRDEGPLTHKQVYANLGKGNYPHTSSLGALRKQGFLESYVPHDTKHGEKVYKLTDLGRSRLLELDPKGTSKSKGTLTPPITFRPQGYYDPKEDFRTPARQGAMDAFRFPSRQFDGLHYREARGA